MQLGDMWISAGAEVIVLHRQQYGIATRNTTNRFKYVRTTEGMRMVEGWMAHHVMVMQGVAGSVYDGFQYKFPHDTEVKWDDEGRDLP